MIQAKVSAEPQCSETNLTKRLSRLDSARLFKVTLDGRTKKRNQKVPKKFWQVYKSTCTQKKVASADTVKKLVLHICGLEKGFNLF